MYIYTCSLCFQVFYSHDGWFLARQAVLYTNRSIGVMPCFANVVRYGSIQQAMKQT